MTNERWDVTLARRASRRHGVVSRAEALAAGASASAIQRRLALGRWRLIFPGVYVVEGNPPSWRQTLLAACLAAGPDAVASHTAAAALRSLAGFKESRIEITAARSGVRHRRFTVHRVRSLPASEVTRVDGIPVTTVARTLVDLAATQPLDSVEIALDDALHRRLVTAAQIRRVIERDRIRGGPAIRDLLAARPAGVTVPESPLETMFVRLVHDHGLPQPTHQHALRLGGRRMRLDFAYPQAKVAIEADGYRHHNGRRSWESDRERRNLLTAAGWRVLQITWTDVDEHPAETASRIRRLLATPILGE
ncbi:MAG TPA: DUF559 domain-containing protein [Actinomycetota bacterium]|nr:DUF559 domain-containing protein [Actinomycetota bacterium]